MLVLSLSGRPAKCFLANIDATPADWCRDGLLNVHSIPQPVINMTGPDSVSSRPVSRPLCYAADRQQCGLSRHAFPHDTAARLRVLVSQSIAPDGDILFPAGAITKPHDPFHFAGSHGLIERRHRQPAEFLTD
jgi:hypothetical protein